jgi:PRTRC genetic system protein C
MAIEVKPAIRRFEFDGLEIPDPGPEFSVEEIRDIASARRPDILTAVIEGPTIKGNVVEYKFVRNVGSKGMRHSTVISILSRKTRDNCVKLHEALSPEVTACVNGLNTWIQSTRSKTARKIKLESRFIPPLF